MPLQRSRVAAVRRCSFCGKREGEVGGNGPIAHFIPGPNSVSICEECVELAHEMVRERRDPRPWTPLDRP